MRSRTGIPVIGSLPGQILLCDNAEAPEARASGHRESYLPRHSRRLSFRRVYVHPDINVRNETSPAQDLDFTALRERVQAAEYQMGCPKRCRIILPTPRN